MDNLNKLMDLTRQVQSLVEAGDWSEAAALEHSRKPLVEAFLSSSPSQSEMARAGEVFEKVVAIDARMLARIGNQRQEALLEMREERGASEAARAYLAHAVPDQRR